MKAIDVLREVSAALSEYGIEDTHKEAEIIITRCMNMGKVALYRDNPVLSPVHREEINTFLERRRKREPIQYIVGHVDFYGLEIHVGPGVLVPRPETEIMAEEVIKTVKHKASGMKGEAVRVKGSEYSSLRILDLCTGSGCLALALAKEFPKAELIAVDVSRKALEYAIGNARINNIRNITFMSGNLYEPVKDRNFDIIVANPPYIRSEDICTLQPEIENWEPLEALDGGKDGLRFYREILSGASDYLVRGGSLFLELGRGEAQDVLKIAEKSGVGSFTLVKDYAGIERIFRLSLQ
jgi:release factor glutamine methyltransferase